MDWKKNNNCMVLAIQTFFCIKCSQHHRQVVVFKTSLTGTCLKVNELWKTVIQNNCRMLQNGLCGQWAAKQWQPQNAAVAACSTGLGECYCETGGVLLGASRKSLSPPPPQSWGRCTVHAVLTFLSSGQNCVFVLTFKNALCSINILW